jgi:hypothetical protein
VKSNEQKLVVKESDLKAGDILFEMDDSGANHALIYLGSETELGSKLTVAHADFKTYERLLKTSLPAGHYTIFRSNDPELATLAAKIAENWATYNTPYDIPRLCAGLDIHNEKIITAKGNLDSIVEEHRKDFDIMDVIKYAGRAKSSMCRPAEEGENEEDTQGACCAMFVLICYQAAAVLKADLVKPIVGNGQTTWISNKHADPNQLEQCFAAYEPEKDNINEYASFCQTKATIIASCKEYIEENKTANTDNEHQSFTPAIAAWNLRKGAPSEFPVKQVLPSGLILDSKINPAIFRRALSLDNVGFQNPFKNDELVIPTKNYTTEEKEAYKAEIDDSQAISKGKEALMKALIKGEAKELKIDLNIRATLK